MDDHLNNQVVHRQDGSIGQYTIIKSLSSTVWSDNFLVRHETDGFLGRLDLYATWLSRDTAFRRSFEHMAPIMVSHEHIGLGRHYEFGVSDGRLYTVEEHFTVPSPRTWNRVFDGQANLSIPTLQRTTIELCHALHAVHILQDESGQRLGLLYRDPIPGHIFFQTDGRAKLRAPRPFSQQWLNRSRYRINDRQLMFFRPPEESHDHQASISGDMYALARSILMMHYPAAAHKAEQRQREFTRLALIQITEQNPTLGRALTKALDPDPTQRFPSAAAMAQSIPPLTERQLQACTNEIEQFRIETKDERRKMSDELATSIEKIRRIQQVVTRPIPTPLPSTPLLRRPPMINLDLGDPSDHQHIVPHTPSLHTIRTPRAYQEASRFESKIAEATKTREASSTPTEQAAVTTPANDSTSSE